MQFDEVYKQTLTLRDALGVPVDAAIVGVVAGLRFHGIYTTSSCEGHPGRHTGGPYVMFTAVDFEKYKRAYMALSDKTSVAFKKAYSEAVRRNMDEVGKVLSLLDDFYDTRQALHSDRIVIRCFGTAEAKLMCQNADMSYVVSESQQKKIIERNQEEFNAFALFLKERTPRR